MTQATAVTLVPRRISDRYEVQNLLGRGGMALAYHVTDLATGREMALKQLVFNESDVQREEQAALFEREFHALAQLSHPRIIEVYDYGVGEEGPYYTMELLDGGDLRQKTPLPWKEACALSYDVCSSLALLHSRRLVHRDVTPRNIRCTRDGQAKLIDFGAMAPMGPGGMIVGTPSFVAPEVVLGSVLDARADLFSLGATLYFALTGRAAFPARDFSQLPEMWRTKPPPPSHFVDTVPSALDALIVSLLDLEPSMRPHTAFDVMHRLSAIAGLERVEPPSVSRAYLTAPAMVGRDDVTTELRAQLGRAFGGRGRGLLIVGAPGIGRSRMLDACALTAKILGATVLRAAAKISRGDFAVARSLAEQLVRLLPEAAARGADSVGVGVARFDGPRGEASEGSKSRTRLQEFMGPGLERPESQESLVRWMFAVSKEHPLLVAVDDVEHVDEPSRAFLALLASRANRQRLLVAATAEDEEDTTESVLGVLASHSKTLTLNPLTAVETEELLESVFGDVPNVGLVSREIHAVSRGNPRTCMDLAQHLVDSGRVLYDAGTWTLPSVLDASDLPGSAEEAIRERIDALAPLSRFIAEAQALALHAAFTREDYARLCPRESPEQLERAVTELLSHQVLVSDGRLLTLSHAGWAAALKAPLSDAQQRERHRALVSVHEYRRGLLVVHHLLAAGAPERALDRLVEVVALAGDSIGLSKSSELNTTQVAEVFARAIDAAEALRRHPREINDLRRWLASQSVSTDHSFYWHVAPAWLAQLEHDSGLDRWRELASVSDEGERRSQAIDFAYQAHAATPEAERVYRPDEAIKALVHYVVISIAIGSRTQDAPLLRSLPPLLTPFVPLSPVIEAMWHNATATREAVCDGQSEQYLARSLDVYKRLDEISKEQLPHVDLIRHAIEFGIGSVSANLGLASATQWAELLEQDALHQVNALYLRKAIRLQAGDWEGAEEFRKKAEILALRARTRQMFDSTLVLEMSVHAMARDLTGLKQVIDRIELRAARSPGWVPHRHVAEGHFQHICGNLELARAAYERALPLTAPDPEDSSRLVTAFPAAMAGLVATLVDLGLAENAKVEGERALAACTAHGIQAQAHPLVRALSLAEAKLGDYVAASERLEQVILDQTKLGVTGLLLGATYEARARVAIWAGDEGAVERFGRLTAQEYRHGLGSPLGARYERLMDEARRAVALTLPKLWQFESTRMAGNPESATAIATQLLRGAETPKERATRVLQKLCSGRAANEGHLYLCEEGGPALVASQGAEEPPAELFEFVREYLTRELQSGGGETAMVSASPSPSLANPLVFTDPSGRPHRLIFLTAVVNQTTRYAAIAVVVDGAGVSRSAEFALASALASHLIEAGDTLGVTADD